MLMRRQISFADGMMMVRFQLVLYRYGFWTLDVADPTKLFDGTRLELRTLVPAESGRSKAANLSSTPATAHSLPTSCQDGSRFKMILSLDESSSSRLVGPARPDVKPLRWFCLLTTCSAIVTQGVPLPVVASTALLDSIEVLSGPCRVL